MTSIQRGSVANVRYCSVEIIRDHVAGGVTTSVFTVRGGQPLIIPDLVISNDNSFIACCQRVLRGTRYCTGMVIGWPLSATKNTRTFAGAAVLRFFKSCTCLGGRWNTSPDFSVVGAFPSASSRMLPSRT